MRDVPEEFQSENRVISATALLHQREHSFQEIDFTCPYNFSSYSEAYFSYNNTYVRYGVVAGDSTIYKVSYTIPSMSPTASTLFAMPTGTPISEEYRTICLSGDGSAGGPVIVALNGKIYQRRSGAWVQLVDLKDTVTGIVPKIELALTPDLHTLAIAAVYSGAATYDHCKLSVMTTTSDYNFSTIDTWKGYLPKSNTRPNLAASVGFGIGLNGVLDGTNDGSDGGVDTIYLYVDDWSGKKPVYIQYIGPGQWSATKPILPIDATDEESAFTVGSIVNTGNYYSVFLTGLLKRQYGSSYAVVMRGPEKFTFDRNLIAAKDITEPLFIFRASYFWPPVGDVVLQFVYIAVGKTRAFATADCPIRQLRDNTYEPTFFGYNSSNGGGVLDLKNLSIASQVNTADQLSFQVTGDMVSQYAEDLIPGTKIDLALNVNGVQFTERTYSIDRIRTQESTDDATYQVDCSSYNLKKLLDWESDTYFDYLGQAEVHGDPGDLTKLVRAQGAHYEQPDTGGLQLQSLNDDGMLYAVPAASCGGFIRCKFTNMQTTNTMVGVGLNYGQETLAQAASRLGKKVEDTTADNRGSFGLFAIYYPDPKGSSNGQVWLADYNTIRKGYGGDNTITNAWRVLSKTDITRPAANGTLILAMTYQDGIVRVSYANTDTGALTPLFSQEAILDTDNQPTEHENYGRGAIFLRNNTGSHMAYPTTDDCDVIPLYSLADRYKVTGVPLEDRTDKFPASNGTVKIDDELILYTGLAGWQDNSGADRRTTDLTWVPGEILANAGDGLTTPAGTDTDFAKSRGNGAGGACTIHGNNYVLQSLSIPAGKTITAVRVWLKAINYPEDSVMLTIQKGNFSNSASAVDLCNRTYATGTLGPGSTLSGAGNWVTFYLDKDVEIDSGDPYWIMLRRSKNWNHPTSTSYFQYKKMADSTYPGGGCYVFCEEDDTAVGQSGDMAFVVYGKVEGVNKEACIPVLYQTGKGLPTSDPAQTFFNGCAITVTLGSGVNNCYRIVRSYRYTSGANDLYLFFVDRAPGQIFDIDTRLRAVPAFYGLSRGRSATLPTAHAGASPVNMPTSVYALGSYFESYTADEDFTLTEVAQDILRKAGVIRVGFKNRATVSNITVPPYSQNMIMLLQWECTPNTEESITVRFTDDALTMLASVSIDYGTITIGGNGVDYGQIYIWTGSKAITIPITDPISYANGGPSLSGVYRVSLYDGHISVWRNGSIVAAAHLDDNLPTWTKCDVTSSMYGGNYANIIVPQAGTRVDNFSMDMGKTGMSLLQTLIGEKRVYFRENVSYHCVDIFTDRDMPPVDVPPYDRSVSISTLKTDIGFATRVLLEGGELAEVSSAGNLIDAGNLFHLIHLDELNDETDAQYFAEMIMDDMALNREQVEISGAADPSMEPGDQIAIIMKDGSRHEIVVDAISTTLTIDETDAVYDMRLTGRLVY